MRSFRTQLEVTQIVPFTEVVDTLGGEGVVVPLPGELRLDEALGCQTLHGLDDLKVRHIELFVLGGVVVFLGDKDTLYVDTTVQLAMRMEGTEKAHP